MAKRAFLVCLGVGMLAATSGCICHPGLYAPFGPGTLCGPAHGPGPGAATCGPTCGSGGDVCGDPCEDVCGDTCGTAYGGPGHPPCGPLSWLFAIFCHGYRDNGCGEVWWGDWHGAPPDCNDPCDRCGNWTGDGYQVSSGPSTGNCNGGESFDYTMKHAPRIVSQTDRVVSPIPTELPTQAPRPRQATAKR